MNRSDSLQKPCCSTVPVIISKPPVLESLRDHPKNDSTAFIWRWRSCLCHNMNLPLNDCPKPGSGRDGFTNKKQAQWYLALCYLCMANPEPGLGRYWKNWLKMKAFDKQAEARELLESYPQ